MDIHDVWEKALKQTEVIRSRIKPLSSDQTTKLDYIFLSESGKGTADTVVRKGHVDVEKPALLLPPNNPSFEGFDLGEKEHFPSEFLINYFLVRGIQFPSLKYNNISYDLAIREGRLQKAIDHFHAKLQKDENLTTGLVVGPEECWQFSVIIFVGLQVLRSSDGDFKKLLERYKRGS